MIKIRHLVLFILLLYICLNFYSCTKVKEKLNENQMIGFWGISYTSPDFSTNLKYSRGEFKVQKNEIYSLRLVLRKKKPGDFQKAGNKLSDFQIEDHHELISIIDIIQDIIIKISNNEETITITTKDIIEYNTGEFAYIIDRNIMQQIRLSTIKLQSKRNTIIISAPYIDLSDWSANFVLGFGAQGSELIWK